MNCNTAINVERFLGGPIMKLAAVCKNRSLYAMTDGTESETHYEPQNISNIRIQGGPEAYLIKLFLHQRIASRR